MLYAGSILNLICVITLNSVLSPFLGDLIVTSIWTKLRRTSLSSNGGGHITVSPTSQQGITTTYSSTVMFNTLQLSDSGNYTCEVTVAHVMSPVRNVMNGTNSSTTTIRVQSKKAFSFVSIQCMYAVYFTVYRYSIQSSVECKMCTCTGYSVVCIIVYRVCRNLYSVQCTSIKAILSYS